MSGGGGGGAQGGGAGSAALEDAGDGALQHGADLRGGDKGSRIRDKALLKGRPEAKLL